MSKRIISFLFVIVILFLPQLSKNAYPYGSCEIILEDALENERTLAKLVALSCRGCKYEGIANLTLLALTDGTSVRAKAGELGINSPDSTPNRIALLRDALSIRFETGMRGAFSFDFLSDSGSTGTLAKYLVDTAESLPMSTEVDAIPNAKQLLEFAMFNRLNATTAELAMQYVIAESVLNHAILVKQGLFGTSEALLATSEITLEGNRILNSIDTRNSNFAMLLEEWISVHAEIVLSAYGRNVPNQGNWLAMFFQTVPANVDGLGVLKAVAVGNVLSSALNQLASGLPTKAVESSIQNRLSILDQVDGVEQSMVAQDAVDTLRDFEGVLTEGELASVQAGYQNLLDTVGKESGISRSLRIAGQRRIARTLIRARRF